MTGALTARETADLAGQLASRRDWPALWRLARGLPLAEAVLATRWFDDKWQPGSDRDRPLFSLLRQADAGGIASTRDALLAPLTVHINTDDEPCAASFSPDSRQLLVATKHDDRYTGCRVYDLPAATLSEQRDAAGYSLPVEVLHLGEAFYVVAVSPAKRYELVRHDTGGPVVIDATSQDEEGLTIFRHPAGFVAEKHCGPWEWVHNAGRTTGRLCDARGNYIGDVVNVPGYAPDPDWGGDPVLRVIDPRTGRAVLWRRRTGWLTDGDCTRLEARLPRVRGQWDRPAGMVFPGPDRLAVFYHGGRAELYRRTGAGLSRESRVSLPDGLRSFVMLRGEIAALDESRRLTYLSETLTPVTQSRPLAGASGWWLRGSDDGQCLALCGLRDRRGFADVICGCDPALASLASRPLAEMSPADLALATAALGGRLAGVSGPFLELLCQCLEQRFEADVAVTGVLLAPSGQDEVGLAGTTGGTSR